MAQPNIELWFDVLKGYNAHHADRLEQSRSGVELVTAQNIIPDPPGEWVTSPGFSKVRGTAISGTPAITGIFHMGDLADSLILVGSDGEHYQDSANPPAAIASGTDFTSGAGNLVRGTIFNNVLITVSKQRDAPQQITSSIVRSDLSGTPPKGVDVKSFGRRVWMFSPNISGTIWRHIASFGTTDDVATTWTNPSTTEMLNFGTPGGKFNVLGGEVFEDHLMAFTEDSVFPIYQTVNSDLPFAYQSDVLDEEGGGPASIHSVVKADKRLYWISRNFDVKMMLPNKIIKSIGFPVHVFLRGINESRKNLIVGGFEPRYRMVVWCLSNGSDTQNKTALCLHVDTGWFFIRTISRNAFGYRIVSGQPRLIGGGYAGFFYNEFDSSTTGNLDDSTALIDADIQGPRHHLGMPGVIKKGVIMAVVFDPISTETVTVQGNYGDETAFTSLNSTVTMSGTDYKTAYFKLNPFEYFQPRFRDANSGERIRVLKYGFSRPTSNWLKKS